MDNCIKNRSKGEDLIHSGMAREYINCATKLLTYLSKVEIPEFLVSYLNENSTNKHRVLTQLPDMSIKILNQILQSVGEIKQTNNADKYKLLMSFVNIGIHYGDLCLLGVQNVSKQCRDPATTIYKAIDNNVAAITDTHKY